MLTNGETRSSSAPCAVPLNWQLSWGRLAWHSRSASLPTAGTGFAAGAPCRSRPPPAGRLAWLRLSGACRLSACGKPHHLKDALPPDRDSLVRKTTEEHYQVLSRVEPRITRS